MKPAQVDPVRVNSKSVLTMFGISYRTLVRRINSGAIPKPHKDGQRNFWLYTEIKEIAEAPFSDSRQS